MAVSDNITIRTDRDGRFYVVLAFRLPMEDMFDDAIHMARFDARVDAEALKERLIARFFARANKTHGVVDVIDRRYWQGPTSLAAPMRWDATVDPFIVPPTRF